MASTETAGRLTQSGPLRPGWVASPWLTFAARRLGRLVVATGTLLTLTFLMLHLVPGDPVRSSLPPGASAELIRAKRHELGLDKSLPAQFVDYVGDVLHGRFGTSIATGESVGSIVANRLPPTVQIATLAFLTILVIALPTGIAVAVLTRSGRRWWLDAPFTFVTGFVGAIPQFLGAVGLVFVFSVTLKWLPVAGRTGVASYILPIVALSAGLSGHLARIVRVETLVVLEKDYLRTARSKRLSVIRTYGRHALPNILTSVLTISGMMLPGLIGGTVLVESVFAWPGLGTTLVQAILAQDYQVVQGIVLLLGIIVLVTNLVVDVALALIDPQSSIRST